MNCEVCDVNPIEWVLTPTGPEGFPQTICSACLARFGLEAAKKVLPPEEIAQQLGPMFVNPARTEVLAKGSKRRKGEEPQAEPQPEPAPEPASGDDEAAAAASDA